MTEKRFYIHCADNINKQLFDTESDFSIHIEEVSDEELFIQLYNLLNELAEENEQLKEENELLQKQAGELNLIIANDILDKYQIALNNVGMGGKALKRRLYG